MHIYSGVVVRGKQRGRELGYPTLNIASTDTDVSGIFAARVTHGEKVFQAAAFADPARGVLEAYLLDFSQDLYGETVRIELLKKMRETKKFDSEEMLKKAIASDVETVRQYFSNGEHL